MTDPYAYSIEIKRGTFDGETCFQARALEFPDLYEYADTYEEAYSLIIDAISTTAEAFEEMGQQMPAPFDTTDGYSGRVTLRLPKSLHASLSRRAENEDVSLNLLMTSILSAYRGFDMSMSEIHNEWRRLLAPKISFRSHSVRDSKPLTLANDEQWGKVA